MKLKIFTLWLFTENVFQPLFNKKRNQTIGRLIDMGEDKRETEQSETMLQIKWNK